jgi:hypothetical protein
MNRKKQLIVVLSLILIAMLCVILFVPQQGEEEPKSDWKEKFLPEAQSPEKVVENIEKEYHVTYTTVATDSSYWYVILEGQATRWHGTVRLPTPYFDFVKALKQFEKVKKPAFFKLIVQVNKESLKTFGEYEDLNYKEE